MGAGLASGTTGVLKLMPANARLIYYIKRWGGGVTVPRVASHSRQIGAVSGWARFSVERSSRGRPPVRGDSREITALRGARSFQSKIWNIVRMIILWTRISRGETGLISFWRNLHSFRYQCSALCYSRTVLWSTRNFNYPPTSHRGTKLLSAN